MSSKYSNTFVIFCYNEEKNVEDTFVNLNSAILDHPLFTNSTILFIDDCSTDNTYGVMQKIQLAFPNVLIYQNIRNLGIGKTILRGLDLSHSDFVCSIPGDGQFDPKDLRLVYSLNLNEIVSFTRRKHEQYNFFRVLLTNSNKRLNRLLFGLKLEDVNWVKIISKQSVNTRQIIAETSYIESEICIKHLKNKGSFKEIQTTYLLRNHGKSNAVNFKNLFKIGIDVLYLYLKLKLKL